jgi:hypothetical protein
MNARHRVGRSRAHVVRAPRFLDVKAMASALDRFEFAMQLAAWRTRDRSGRALSNGLQVRKLSDGGWEVGYPDVGAGAWTRYTDPRMAFEHARRTGLGHYTTEAENLRAELLS